MGRAPGSDRRGHLTPPDGMCTSRTAIVGHMYLGRFVALPQCSRDMILAMKFLTAHGAVVDLQSISVTSSTEKTVPQLRVYQRPVELRTTDEYQHPFSLHCHGVHLCQHIRKNGGPARKPDAFAA